MDRRPYCSTLYASTATDDTLLQNYELLYCAQAGLFISLFTSRQALSGKHPNYETTTFNNNYIDTLLSGTLAGGPVPIMQRLGHSSKQHAIVGGGQ
jgi:hypothetical protein